MAIVAIALIVSGCDVFADKAEEEVRDPDTEVKTYVAAFVAAAQARGFDVGEKVGALEIVFEDRLVFDGTEYCGYVPLTEDLLYGNQVLLAANASCWWDRSVNDREALVFHELGHAVLDRPHKNAKLPNGAWASLMLSDPRGGLYGGHIANRRPYYLDELFDETTPAPDWSR